MNTHGKRDILRNKAEWNDHFICLHRGEKIGVWLNYNRLRVLEYDELVDEISEIFKQTGLVK
jgi:hypothetical protein